MSTNEGERQIPERTPQFAYVAECLIRSCYTIGYANAMLEARGLRVNQPPLAFFRALYTVEGTVTPEAMLQDAVASYKNGYKNGRRDGLMAETLRHQDHGLLM